MQIDTCKLCGETKELNFEHVPPRTSFNKATKYRIIKHIDFLQEENPLKYEPKGKIEQGGTGFYSYCKNCNSFLGSKYVRPFDYYLKSIARELKNNDDKHLLFTIIQLEPLKILKQIVSMFIAINDIHFFKNNSELVEFVRNPDTCYLPDRYRFFNYINTEGQLRYLPISMKGNFITRVSIINSEITFPPLSYVMTINYDGKMSNLTEITSFKNYKLESKLNCELEMIRLPTHLLIPLDYRDKLEIENAIGKP